ncbi:DUF883 C-terminal domain-containing protein [Paraburkholderia sp. CNPSo 3076]|uniref:DUF883 C-terminal domain-containing protein n=1 Tax=Paraburkholderia sp. CNPSo 3076 TaxID=2940936 RepID=UPI0022546D73|nr:DUF883 C-terminal domain-containing protein [Paraburkholderia sp. CNPSo 3076]MCX5539393.1 DUF883 C-terminal domain-containing protein [Paraburkholderia sp. CNPSo 3076]
MPKHQDLPCGFRAGRTAFVVAAESAFGGLVRQEWALVEYRICAVFRALRRQTDWENDMSMGSTKTDSAVSELAANAPEAVGEMLGDASMRLSGNARALCGKSKQLATDAAVVTREAIADNPLATLGIAVGIGFALGALWAANRE